MKTWKDIERAREIRHWVERIIGPAVIIGGCMILAFKDEIKSGICKGARKVKKIFVKDKTKVENKG